MRAVVSLANSKGNYLKALDRLAASVKDVPFFGFTDESQVGAPPHDWLPYAFKVFAIRKVVEMGYRQILWLDSSCVAVGDIAKVFDHIDKYGYIMQDAGHYVTDWCNAAQRAELCPMPHWKMYGNAGFLGLNFDDPIAAEFFRQWFGYRHLFAGSWDNSRHDMTVGSIIANRLSMEFQSGDEWLSYASPAAPKKNDTIIIHAEGM